MIEPKEIQIGDCTVLLWQLGHHLQTVFPDGLKVDAAANYDPDSLQRARELGYETTWEMSRDHELSHHLLARAQGQPYSLVIRGVAVRESGGNKESVISRWESDAEEGRVLEFQRYVMTGDCSPSLWWWARERGIDLEAVASVLRELVRG